MHMYWCGPFGSLSPTTVSSSVLALTSLLDQLRGPEGAEEKEQPSDLAVSFSNSILVLPQPSSVWNRAAEQARMREPRGASPHFQKGMLGSFLGSGTVPLLISLCRQLGCSILKQSCRVKVKEGNGGQVRWLRKWLRQPTLLHPLGGPGPVCHFQFYFGNVCKEIIIVWNCSFIHSVDLYPTFFPPEKAPKTAYNSVENTYIVYIKLQNT